MSGKLEAKVAPVTGDCSGIGLATTKRSVAEGAHMFFTGAGQQNSKRRRKRSPAITGIQSDVAELAETDRLLVRSMP
jgi:NAD(P)-dependent dehydrogenase (short-subunit alcohol dehydrogenase family)